MRRIQKYDVLLHLIEHKEPLTMPEAYKLYHTPVLKTVISALHKDYELEFNKVEQEVTTPYGKKRVMTYSIDGDNRKQAITILKNMGYITEERAEALCL